MATSSVLHPIRYINENAYTARYRVTAKPRRPGPLNLSDANNYYAESGLSTGQPGTPFSAFMEQLVCDYEDMDELDLYAADTNNNDGQIEEDILGKPQSRNLFQINSAAWQMEPAASEYRPVLPRTKARRSTVQRSVPAVRVGDAVLPIRVRAYFGQRRRTTDLEVIKAENARIELQDQRVRDEDAEDESSYQSPSKAHRLAHTKSFLSCDDVVGGMYGISSVHQRYADSSEAPFHVLHSLGHGSLGIVEEVRTSPSKASFVRKRIQIPYSSRAQRLKIAQQEAASLRSLSHAHIVKLLGTYEDGASSTGRHFYSLLMSPVGDSDLRAFLDIIGDKHAKRPRASGLPANPGSFKELSWLRKWFGCLASALAHMHAKGVRHQDIKPSNIVLRGADVFFTDFSSASPFDVARTTSTETPARNSLMYAAPETVRAPHEESYKRHGLAADIFSLACVFVEMLTVLDGRRVGDLHEFCLLKGASPTEAEKPGAEGLRNVLLYSRVVRRTERWFESAKSMQAAMFSACVRPMLREGREDRPSAAEVLETIRSRQPWRTAECSCC